MLRRGAAAVCLSVSLTVPLVGTGSTNTSGAPASSAPVYTFPIPGAVAALPGTQLAFRGAMPTASSIQVVGSSSGVHGGIVEPDSDGAGGSFIPTSAFAPGETVTVRTPMNVVGARNGTYSFTVVVPASRPIPLKRVVAHRVPGSIQRFKSRPDLAPAAVRIIKNSRNTAAGDVFLEPQSSPVQDGPQIRDWQGHLIWYQPMPRNQYVSDFRAQTLDGQPVLTWWQGYVSGGVGYGIGAIESDSYTPIGTVRGEGGAVPDLHEFLISREGTALVTSFYLVERNLRSVGGPAKGALLDSLVQEIDIKTGLLLFEWNSLDHVPLRDSYKRYTSPWDYFHANNVQELSDGSLLISGRNTWAAYDVNRDTGQVMWTLGGKHSSFRMGAGSRFAFQHDVEMRAHNLVTMFDDGAGPPVIHNSSRVLGLRLDFRRKRASKVISWEHSPKLLSFFEGNAQELPGGHYFVGWGLSPYFSEFNSSGRLIFDGRFVSSAFSNRAYRFQWNATPAAPPDVAVARQGSRMTVYASWNGATGVSYWRILAGRDPQHLVPLRRIRKTNFETSIGLPASRYVAIEALDSRGNQFGAMSRVVQG